MHENETLRIGNMGKAVEIASGGKVLGNTPIILTRAVLDQIASDHPGSYLRLLEELCASMRNVIAVQFDEGESAVCMVTAGATESNAAVFIMEIAPDGAVRRAERVGELELKGKWLPAKKIVRSRKYRR